MPQDQVGIVNGLAWTSASAASCCSVEVLSMQGSGKLELTGHLGDVMKESAQSRRQLYPQATPNQLRRRPRFL